MAMVATVVDTVDTEATTARGMLMPRLPLPLRLMLSPAMATDTAGDMDMAVMATDVSMVDTDTARGRLRLLLMLSPAMDTDTDMAVDMDMVVMDVSMEDTDTARGLLRLMLSPDTETTAVDTDMAVDMDMAVMDVSMEDTDMARGPLRLMLSPDMDTTAVDMVATDTDVSMVDTADTMDKSKSNQSSFLH